MEAAGVREGKGQERAEWSWPCSCSLRPPHPSSTPLVRTGPGAPNWAFQAAPWIHRVSSPRCKRKPKEGQPGCSARPRASGLFVPAPPLTPAAPFLWFWGGPAPFPQPPLHTHCLRAGAHAPPETGSRGASGPPLLTRDSWTRILKSRGWGTAGTPLGNAIPMLSYMTKKGRARV